MSYEEKGQWVYLVVTVVAVLAYAVLLIGRADGTPLAQVDYGPILLWTIGLGIAATIVARILLEIAKPSDGYASDVRDRDIDRFGEYVGGTILGIGMAVPFLLAIAEADYFWIANSMYFVFALAAIVGTTIKLIAYRRGF
jgi:hypothetical protein